MLAIMIMLHLLGHNRHLCPVQPGHPLLHVIRRFPGCRIRPAKVIFRP